LIASARARSLLREIVADEFPRMGVLARLELAPEADIEDLGQLKLP
jgi:flagellar biosynthesis component FlhA